MARLTERHAERPGKSHRTLPGRYLSAGTGSLIEIELAEPLPTTIQVGFDAWGGPCGERVRVEHVVGGECVITIERGDLAKYPGARVL